MLVFSRLHLDDHYNGLVDEGFYVCSADGLSTTCMTGAARTTACDACTNRVCGVDSYSGRGAARS